MISRPFWHERIENCWRKAPIVWLSGVRRVGKTTLAETIENALRTATGNLTSFVALSDLLGDVCATDIQPAVDGENPFDNRCATAERLRTGQMDHVPGTACNECTK